MNPDHSHDDFAPEELADEITQPLPLAHSLRARHARPGEVFLRLAEAFEVTPGSLEVLLSELLRFHDASSATLTEMQVWSMRMGLGELVDNVLPEPTRGRARARLQRLLMRIEAREPS